MATGRHLEKSIACHNPAHRGRTGPAEHFLRTNLPPMLAASDLRCSEIPHYCIVVIPQLELDCFTTIRLTRYVPYLQPQTVHKHSLTEITELASIFGGMLTVATWLTYDSNRQYGIWVRYIYTDLWPCQGGLIWMKFCEPDANWHSNDDK